MLIESLYIAHPFGPYPFGSFGQAAPVPYATQRLEKCLVVLFLVWSTAR